MQINPPSHCSDGHFPLLLFVKLEDIGSVVWILSMKSGQVKTSVMINCCCAALDCDRQV